MDFIKKMKKREFIEMGLKCLASVLAAFLAIILMEGMIYSIMLNAAYQKNGASGSETIIYAIKLDDTHYDLITYNPSVIEKNKNTILEWGVMSNYTQDKIDQLSYKEIYYQAPNAFQLYINSTHYIVMAVFVLAVSGFFIYRFIKLAKSYKDLEEEFNRTGTIELPNL